MDSILEKATLRFNESLVAHLQPTIEGVQHLIKEQALHEVRMNKYDDHIIQQCNEITTLKELVSSLSHVELKQETAELAETETQHISVGSQTEVFLVNEQSRTEMPPRSEDSLTDVTRLISKASQTMEEGMELRSGTIKYNI